MSLVSQTPPSRRLSRRVIALPLALAGAALLLALTPLGQAGLRAVEGARLHGPDLALWAQLSTPIKIHLATALAGLGLGAVLMAVRKGRLFHRIAGWVWVSLVAVTAGATLFITELNRGSWSLLHLITGWVLIVLPLAVMFAKRHDIAKHRAQMMGLFYGGFAINLFIAMIPGRTLWRLLFG